MRDAQTTYPHRHSFREQRTRGCLCFVLLSVTLFSFSGCKHKEHPTNSSIQRVDVVTVKQRPTSVDTFLPGRVSAFEQAQIRPQVGGLILRRFFEQGADVKAGQLLYQINPAPFKASYDQAHAALLHAQAALMSIKAQLERYRPLVKAHAISRQEFDNTLSSERQAVAEVASAKAAQEFAAVNLQWTKVRSPIDGRIGRTLLTVGTLVTAAQTSQIAIVTRLDPIYVDLELPSVTMLRLRRELAAGQLERTSSNRAAVELELDDGSTYAHKGALKLLEVTEDPTSGTLVMRAEFPNPEKLLMPGMYVRASVHEWVDPHATAVPQTALQRDTRGDAYVLLVNKDDKVEQRSVTVGQALGSDWIIKKGLKSGDRVIFSGLQKIKPGQKVAPVDATEKAMPEPGK